MSLSILTPEKAVIAESPIATSYCLTPMQHGILFHSLSSANDGVYMVQVLCNLPTGTDLLVFLKSWHVVIERHEILRTSFMWEGLNEPVQRVHKHAHVPTHIQNWTAIPPDE